MCPFGPALYARPAAEPGIYAPPATEPGTGGRRLVRRSGGRIVGGVAGGLADHLGVDVLKVRMVFVLLSALAGSGIVGYGLLWIFTPGGADEARPSGTERRQAIGLALLGLGLALAVSWTFSGTAGQVIAPLVVIAVGAALVWREYDADGPRSLVGMPAKPSVVTWSRIIAGVTLVIAGLTIVVLSQVDWGSLGSALLAVAATLIGVGLLLVPLGLRMMRSLDVERAARIRNEEREEIASHLHDSVLQTLALIQRQSGDQQEVLRLARSQERELRRWLFADTGPAESSLAVALRTIAGEVEDQHGVKVTPVTVGDVAMDASGSGSGLPKEHFTAVLGATREALVNAAKHAGVADIDLFAEAEPHQISVFVRDRGSGFDPDSVPEDRHGLARSIRARVERRGGTVVIDSKPGRGTEVRISVPRKDSGTDPEGRAAEGAAAGNGDLRGRDTADSSPAPEQEPHPISR